MLFRSLAKNGFHVVAVARRTEMLTELSRQDANIETLTIDVTSNSDVDQLAKHLSGKPVEVLICNAGGAFDFDTVATSDPDIWMKTYDVNVVGSVRCIKALLPLMNAHGRGHLVLISSTAGASRPWPTRSPRAPRISSTSASRCWGAPRASGRFS